jgi:hypothetical protein
MANYCRAVTKSLRGTRSILQTHEKVFNSVRTKYILYTDQKENKIFLIYEEIQMGAVAKSYMTSGLLIYD